MASKQKYVYGLLIIILLAAVAAYLGFSTTTYRHHIALPYSMIKTGEQLNNTENIVKWYLPFAGNDTLAQSVRNSNDRISSNDYSIRVTDRSSVNVVLETGYKEKYRRFVFEAVSDSGDMDVCSVYLTYKSTLLEHWLDKGSLERKAVQSLESLKTYMEDTRRFYGFEIEYTTVADTSFIFLSTTVASKEKRAATKKLFDQLIAYAEQKNAGYNGTRIFYSVPFGTDQIMLFASIGVTNRIITNPGEGFSYKRMPFGKNLLMASYQGPYKDVVKAYTALENFKADHHLSSMAIPYQKFISEGYDFADEQVVQMKVYYPIF